MIPFIDMHCDTLTQANFHFQNDLFRLPAEQTDVEKLCAGGACVQFFAICLPRITTVNRLGRLYEGDWKHIRRLAGILYHTCALHGDRIALLDSAVDLDKNALSGRISAVMSVEDGRNIGGDLSMLSLYHRLGVRMITLTWNYPNCFGYPNSPGGKKPSRVERGRGLTDFGKEAVEEMNRLGILIDVSHLSDGGFFDVAERTGKPFVASHSNCRALCDHPRNLTDEMIRTIALKGGIIGLNQNPPFLRPRARRSHFEDLIAHLKHMRDAGGIDCVALGSDFDGCSRRVRMCMKGPQQYPKLAGLLRKNGFSREETEKIFYKNARRVMQETLCHSAFENRIDSSTNAARRN